MAGRPSASYPLKFVRLMRVYAYMDWLFLTRDLGTFLLWTGTDTILSIASVSGMLLIASRFSGVGAWTQPQVVFMLGYAALVEGLVGVFFGYNVSFISRRLGRGQLDHTLIQPQPLWLSLLTEGFSPAFGIPTLIPGILMLSWAILRMQIHLAVGWMAYFAANVVASITIVMSFQFVWGSLAFWSPRSAEEISSSTSQILSGLKSYPLGGMAPGVRACLLTAVPVGFVAWAPAGALMQKSHHFAGLWSTPAAAICFAIPAICIFTAGFNHYVRTGSQRYSDFGHRR